MNKNKDYGWVSYYFNLFLLTPMSHNRRMKFIRGKALAALSHADPVHRLRLLLHCTDWPIDLLQIGPADCVCRTRREMKTLQEEMVERYRREKLAQEHH